MNKFQNYVEQRQRYDLIMALVENGVDVDAFVQRVKDVASAVPLTEAELYNEILGALRAGLAGVGGVGRAALSGAANLGGQALGAASNVASKYGNMALQKGAEMGRGVADTYQQQAQASRIKQATEKIADLERFLTSMKMGDPRMISMHLNSLKDQLGQMQTHNAATLGARFGQGNMAVANPA